MTTREFLLSAWDWDPFVLAALVLALLLFGLACRWKFPGRSLFFPAGLVFLFLALDSPVGFLARGTLFSAHMLQHLLLVLIVPPLLLMGLPAAAGPDPIPGRSRPWVLHPLIAWFAGVGAMWIWHIPALCDAAVSYTSVRVLQTLSLLFLGMLFWRPIVDARKEDRLPPLAGIPYLFTACLACSLLGIWITFAPVGVCPVYRNPADPLGLLPMVQKDWGLTPAADQQIGGLLMWVPACLVYLGAILVLLNRYYRRPTNEMGKKNVRKK